MILGVDFDNTVVRYDKLVHRLARQRGVIPVELPREKAAVRDHLRRQGPAGEDLWTELQGEVYGPGMAEAEPFPGVLPFFARAFRSGLTVYIISHKTRQAVLGPAHDLRTAALEWLEQRGFFDPARIGLSREQVLFAESRRQKVEFIREVGCAFFVDDLEEIFREPGFPAGTGKLWFTTSAAAPGPDIQVMRDWAAVEAYVFAALRGR
jgi:hypothetical protein